MSDGPRSRSRFPRTAGSVIKDRPTIERDKIKHRRPDDMRVYDANEAPASAEPASPEAWNDDNFSDNDQLSWSDGSSEDNEGWPSQDEGLSEGGQDWDSGSDDEWVFDDPVPGDAPAAAESYDDTGVTWDDGSDIQMGTSNVRQDYDNDEITLGPEVELAGRRDVRPKPPKPRSMEARRQQPAGPARGPARARTETEPGEDDFAMERPHAPAAQPTVPQSRGRFARTQSALEIDSEPRQQSPRMQPPPKNLRSTARRRQPQVAPVAPPPRARSRGRKRRPLMMLLVLALIGGGGWFAYKSLGSGDTTALLDSLSETLGVSGRTASDTPFGASGDEPLAGQTPEPVTTEILPSVTDDGTNVPSSTPLDGQRNRLSTSRDNPPIPEFKPRNDVPGLSDAPGTSVQVEQLDAEDLANQPDDGVEDGPSVMQKIWGALISE